MALLKFLKGNYASMSTAAIVEGQVLICGDTGEMFVDVAADKRVKIGDYVTVASLDALMAIDATAVPTSRLYYVEGANILARSNGTTWDQINKDTGATSIEVVGEGNAVTAASYDAVTRKLTLTKGETFATKAEHDAVDGRLQAAEEKLKSVATTEGLGELADTVADHTAAIDTINGTVETEGSMLKIAKDAADGKDAAIKEAKDAADKAQGDVDTLTQTHATDKAALEGAIALKANTADVYNKGEIDGKVDTINEAIAAKANAADVYTQGQVDEMVSALEDADEAINNKIGAVADGKTVVEMIEEAAAAVDYDDTEVRGLIDTNAQAIAKEVEDREGAVSGLKSELEGKINSKVEQSAYDEKVAALEDEDARLAGLIGDNADAISGVSGKVDTLVGEDTDKSVRTIANEELAAQLIAEGAKESLNTLQEIAAWIQEHPDDASAMNAAIEALQAKVDTGDQTVSAYVTAAINALSIGDYATVEALNAAIERIVALEAASATHATKDELQGVADDLDAYKQAHNADYDNDAVDAKVKAVQDQIDALGDTYATDKELTDAIAAEVERANGLYATQANLTTHVDDADIHVTTADKEKWNGVVSDLSVHKSAYDTKVAELEAADTTIRGEFAAADAALKTEMQGYTDQAELDAIAAAKTETETQVGAEKDAREAADAELQSAIDVINDAENGILAQAKADATSKANTAEGNAKSYVEELMSWGSF